MNKPYRYEEDRNVLYINQDGNALDLSEIINENVSQSKHRTLIIKVDLEPLLSYVKINLDGLKILKLSVEQSLGKMFLANHTIEVELLGDYTINDLSIDIKVGINLNINLDRIPRKVHFHGTTSAVRLTLGNDFALDNHYDKSYIIAHKLRSLYLNYYVSHIYVKSPVYNSFYYPDDKPIHSTEPNAVKSYNKAIIFNDKCVVYDYDKILNLTVNDHHPLKDVLKSIIPYIL